MKRIVTAAMVVVLMLAMAVPAGAIAKPGKASSKSMAAKAKGKPVFVSHPFTKKSKLKVGKDFKVWGYVNTWRRVPLTSEATVTIKVQKRAGRSWETSAGLATTASLAASGKFKKKTNYTAMMNIAEKGRYRMKAVLVWKDAKGVEHAKRSSWKYIRIK